MENPDKLTIRVQGELIAKHNESQRAMRKKIADQEVVIARLGVSGTFYNEMAKAIMAHESLQNSWNDFLFMLRMCEPDFEKTVNDKVAEVQRKLNVGNYDI